MGRLSGPPRGAWASGRRFAAPSPPSPARSQIVTRSRNIRAYLRTPLPGGPRSVVVERVDEVGAARERHADRDREVVVRPGRVPAHPDPADELALGHGLAGADPDRGHVAILDIQVAPDVDPDLVATAVVVPAGIRDGPGAGR